MLDFGCGKVTRIVFCLAGSSMSMSWGQLTNGRGVSAAIKSIVVKFSTPIAWDQFPYRNYVGAQFPCMPSRSCEREREREALHTLTGAGKYPIARNEPFVTLHFRFSHRVYDNAALYNVEYTTHSFEELCFLFYFLSDRSEELTIFFLSVETSSSLKLHR